MITTKKQAIAEIDDLEAKIQEIENFLANTLFNGDSDDYVDSYYYDPLNRARQALDSLRDELNE